MKPSRGDFLTRLYRRAFVAALLGSAVGNVALYLFSLALDPSGTLEAIGWLPILTACAFVLSLAALLVLGAPLTFLLRDLAHSPWSVGLGALVGTFAGWLLGVILSAWTYSPRNDLAVASALVGGFTGLFWAMLSRKLIMQWQEPSYDEAP